MTPLITRAQGAACRRAAERIAELRPCTYYFLVDTSTGDSSVCQAVASIGWEWIGQEGEDFDADIKDHQSQVLMALLWCAEIAGE